MNPASMMKFMSAMNTFKNNHPKFAAFMELLIKSGVTEGTVIEITMTKPGEEPVTANMKVLQSDIELFQSLKDMKS
ncbi:MAG: hypothetical protein J6U15_01400 [Lachnospiraceae bacterium]|nr:hypothetical protein [Lachnospiraceae bacterium]